MKADRKIMRLGDVCTVQSGSGFPENLQGQRDETFPFYKVSDMNLPGNEREMRAANNYVSNDTRNLLGARIFLPGSVIFPKVGGAIATNKKRRVVLECCVDNNVMGLTPKSELITSDYLHYFMQHVDIYEFSNKANPPSIRQTTVAGWPIPVPSLDEQKRIVAILDEAFEKIAKATANAERNIANARELFDSLLRNSFLDQSGWTVFDLGDRVRFIDYRGKTPPKADSGVRLITAKNVKMGFIQRAPEEFVDPDAYDGWMTRGLPRPGDVLFTTEAPLGNVAQLDTNEKVMIGQRLITMQPEEGFLQRDFLKWLLMSPGVQAAIWEHATGATVQGIKAKLLKTIPLAAPAVHVQVQLSNLLEDAWQAKGKLESQYREKARLLSELKATILTHAFSGKLTGKKAIAA